MEVLEIPVEGPRISPPRNVRRINVDVEVLSTGCEVEGRYARRGTHRIEIYEDRLDAVLAKVRTDEHRNAIAQSEAMCARQTEQWKKAHAPQLALLRSAEEREYYVAMNCPHAPEHHLAAFGFEHGIPPLGSLAIVSQDGKRKMTPEQWAAASEDQRDAFLRPPPNTGGNEMERSAAVIAKVMSMAMDNGNGNGGKRR